MFTADDSKQKDGERQAPDVGREFAARRTIVKGMASAVPVVMTIGCGQAMAAASSCDQVALDALDANTFETTTNGNSGAGNQGSLSGSTFYSTLDGPGNRGKSDKVMYVDSYGDTTNGLGTAAATSSGASCV